MTRTIQSQKRWRMVGGATVVAAVLILAVLNVIGAGKAALGFGLAFFFLVWPLFFLAVMPLPKPGLDPLTASIPPQR